VAGENWISIHAPAPNLIVDFAVFAWTGHLILIVDAACSAGYHARI
jgi:hypothetical protein